jgi:hypothetical protein
MDFESNCANRVLASWACGTPCIDNRCPERLRISLFILAESFFQQETYKRKGEFKRMRIRKILAVLLALAIAASFSVTAFASSGYGSGGGGGGGGASSYTPPSADNPVPATATQVAAAAAASTSAAGVAVVRLSTVSTVSASAIQDALTRAAGTGAARLQVDALDGRTVVSRVYIDQAAAAALTGTVNLAVFTRSDAVNRANGTFKRYFDNNIASIGLGQQGAFGANIRMAVKVDLSQLNTASLVFYAYDAATGKYAPLQTTYSVDANGYLHFSTPVGGTIVISDKPLARR